MEKSFKRLLSFAVALVMVLGMVPFNGLQVFAATPSTPTEAATAMSDWDKNYASAFNTTADTVSTTGCPFCGAEGTVVWTAVGGGTEAVPLSTTITVAADGHVFFKADTYSTAEYLMKFDSGGTTYCVNMNGKNINADGGIDLYRKGTSIFGGGTYTRKASDRTRSVFTSRTKNTVAGIYGGTFINEDPDVPVINMTGNSSYGYGKIRFYDATLTASNNGAGAILTWSDYNFDNGLVSFNGGTYNGSVSVPSPKAIDLTGVTTISAPGLSVGAGATVNVSGLTAGSSIAVTGAEGAIIATVGGDTANETYFKVYADGEENTALDVIADGSGKLVVAQPYTMPTWWGDGSTEAKVNAWTKDSAITTKFTGGTVRALCPVCGEEKLWTPIGSERADETNAIELTSQDAEHFYISEDFTYEGSYFVRGRVACAAPCLYLNGKTVTVTKGSVLVSGGLNLIGGNGSIIREDSTSAAGFFRTSGESVEDVNIYGGTYKSGNADTPLFRDGYKITWNLYGAEFGYTGTETAVSLIDNAQNSTFNLHSGTIKCGNGKFKADTGNVNLLGGTIEGAVSMKAGTLTLSGTPTINAPGLSAVADGVTVDVSGLTTGSSIAVTGTIGDVIATNGNETVSEYFTVYTDGEPNAKLEVVADENSKLTIACVHDYTYTCNNDGTHTVGCKNGCGTEETATCDTDGDNGSCSKCSYTAPVYVAQVGDDKFESLQDAIVAAVPAGTVELLTDVTVDEWVMITQSLTIGTNQLITVDEINGLTIDGKGKSLTIKSIESATNGGMLFYDATELNIKDLTINYIDAAANAGGIGLTSGTIENVTVNGGVGVFPGTGDITITGCTFNTNGSAIYNEQERDKLVVTGNTFNTAAGQYAIYLRGNTTFTDNTVTSGKVNVTNSATGTISGNNFGTERFKVYNGATATISDNTINNLVFSEPTAVANATFTGNTLSADAQAALDAVTPVYVAEVNGVGYTTLADAVAAAQAGDTVTIMEGAYAVPAMKAGVTYEGVGEVLLEGTLSGTLEDLTLKNLHIKGANAQRWAYAKGDLVFENVTFEATSVYALHFDGITEGATLLYEDCTIIGWAAMSGSPESCVFDGCTIKGNGSYGLIRTYFDATIENCTFDVSDVNPDDVYQDGIHAVDATVTVTNCTNVNGDMKDIIDTSKVGYVILDGETIHIHKFEKGETVEPTYDAEGYTEYKCPCGETEHRDTVAAKAAVAQIGDNKFGSLEAALDAAKAMTGDVTVEIYDKVTLNTALSGSFDSIKFVGKDTDAEVYLDVQGYITATGKKVAFEDLILSKAEGKYITNAGFMNVAFGIYDVAEVTYTDCTFDNGAYAGSGKVTYTGCTFEKSWEKYGLWAYGDVDVTVDGCTFDDDRGIKMYAEGGAKVTELTVKNTDFSKLTGKPAIVLTYGQSVALEGNTYSNTGAFELDLGGAPDGTPVTIDKLEDLVCTNDNGDCGVLVDGKIYTTVAKAAAVATAGDTVTLLHNSTETVELAEGVILNKNGYAAEGVTVKTAGLSGSGTEADPFLIENLEDLLWFQAKVDEQAADGSTQFAGKYFKLTADIDLAGIEWNPIGSMSGDHGSFKGVFDGDGYTISNLNCQQAGNGLGLFARTAGNAEIKNLTLNNVTVKSTNNANYVGAVVGNSYASTKITNVHVTGTVDISGRGYIGGISGHGYVVMDNISVVGEGTISSTFWCAGGILGYGGEGATNIQNAKVEGTGNGLTITSAAGGLGAIVGMAEDNNGTQPISGSNLSAKNVEIKTYTGGYGDAYANYALGYLYGGNPTSKLTGDLKVENVTITTSSGEAPVVQDAVATVNGTIYFSLQDALDAAVAGTGNVTVEILRNVDLSNVDWNPVTVSGPGYPLVTVNGNGKTITGLNDMLFAGTWAGKSGLIINNLTIANSTIENDVDDTKGNVGVGAFIGYPQASATITLNNCHLVDSTVSGGHWTGGLIGMAGGYNGNDGPVFMNLTITGCSVTNSTITGKGSAGGVIGHGSCAAWTNVVIEDTVVSGNTITSTGSSNNKAGSVMGTIGAAGKPTTADGETKTGGAFVSVTTSNNTVTSNGTAISTIYGRQGTNTGVLTLTGGTYENYPIESNVTYAAPQDGYKIEQNGDGTYGLAAVTYVAEVDGVKYESLQAALDAAQDGQTVLLISDIAVTGVITAQGDKHVTLDMNGKTISASTSGKENIFRVLCKLTVTGNGKIENLGDYYAFAVGTRTKDTAGNTLTKTPGELIIENGTFIVSNASVVSVTTGSATINGGYFKTNHSNSTYLLNCIDKTYGEGNAKIVVNGGTFDRFNPMDNTAEGTGTNFCADGYAALPTLENTYVVGKKPTATVNNLGAQTVPAGDYMVYGNGTNTEDMPLNFVMQFLADQTEEDMATSPYADWYGDFVITFTGIENGESFTADGCYLAGHYGSFGWVKVPVDGMVIEEGARYPVMLGVGMGQKYDYICSSVQDFKCALYLTPEILAANPNLQVNLELSIVDNSQGSDAAAVALVNNEAIYEVKDYTYEAEDFKTYVAQIGETKYKSLQAAIDAAVNGDTITFLDDINEDVTVGKSLTIDGAGKNYTGNMHVKGGKAVATIKNVNFVNGSGYAVKTDSINSITIEDCTVTGYATGFLYANRSTSTITVKNVTVDGGNYGMHWVYGNSATLENVVMTNVAYGIMVQNYASKTIDLKNCSVDATNPIYVWERDGKTGVQTFNLEGVYADSILPTSQYATVVAAQCGDYVGDLRSMLEKAQPGDTVTLLADIALTETLVLDKENITLDGNGHKLTMAADYQDKQNALIMVGNSEYGDAEAATHNVTIKNVVFDSLDAVYSIVRAQGATLTVDGCSITNCNQTAGQALLRLDYTEATISNTTIKGNTALMAITHNFNGNSSATKLNVTDCVIENNTFNKTAAIYYVTGSGCQIDKSEFVDNTVNCNTNGAIVYLGFQDNCAVTGNLFKGNKVEDVTGSTRVAGAIFAGYQATITGNAFDNNSAANANNDTLGDVCISTYYEESKIDLSGNYWNGNAPQLGKDITIQHQTGAGDYTLDNYYTAYSLDADGNVVLDGEVANTYVAQIKGNTTKYTSLDDAYAAAVAGDTVQMLADATLTDKLTVNKAITIDGNGKAIIANHSAFILETSADCTFKDITLDTNNKAKGVKIASGNVVFDNVTIPNSNKSDAITVNGSLLLKNYFSVESTYQVFDARNGSVTAEPGTVFDFTSRIGLASPAKCDFKSAVDSEGNPFFCAYASTAYYTSLTALSYSDLTLLDDATLSSTATVSGTLDLNGKTLTVADGKALKVTGNLTITGEGDLDGEIQLTKDIAKVTAPADMNVTSGVADHAVVYNGGVYMLFNENTVAWNVQTGAEYETVAAALLAAKENETVQLLADSDESTAVLTVLNGITLDLNGYKLTAYYAMTATVNSYIVDSTDGEGMLKVAKDNLILADNNKQLKIWKDTEVGYCFASASFKTLLESNGSGAATFRFYLKETYGAVMEELADGAADGDGLTLRIKMTYANSQGGKIAMYFDYPQEKIQEYAAKEFSGTASHLYMTIRGLEKVTDVSFQAVVASGNVVLESDIVPYNG